VTPEDPPAPPAHRFGNLGFAAVLCLTLGLAPFFPEPHIVGKVRWVLGGGVGMAPIDVFDLLMHGAPFVYFGVEAARVGLGLLRGDR